MELVRDVVAASPALAGWKLIANTRSGSSSVLFLSAAIQLFGFCSCRFFALRLHQEAPQQGLFLQLLLLPVSGPARASAGQQQRPPAGRGERNRRQGPGEAAAASGQVERLGKDVRGHRSGRDAGPQLL